MKPQLQTPYALIRSNPDVATGRNLRRLVHLKETCKPHSDKEAERAAARRDIIRMALFMKIPKTWSCRENMSTLLAFLCQLIEPVQRKLAINSFRIRLGTLVKLKTYGGWQGRVEEIFDDLRLKLDNRREPICPISVARA